MSKLNCFISRPTLSSNSRSNAFKASKLLKFRAKWPLVKTDIACRISAALGWISSSFASSLSCSFPSSSPFLLARILLTMSSVMISLVGHSVPLLFGNLRWSFFCWRTRRNELFVRAPSESWFAPDVSNRDFGISSQANLVFAGQNSRVRSNFGVVKVKICHNFCF